MPKHKFGNSATEDPPIVPEAQQEQQPTQPLSTAEAFARLRQRANAGDLAAQTALKQFLNANPQLWEQLGNLARHAEMSFVKQLSAGDWLCGEAIRRKASKMRRKLAGPAPTLLEKMAVERIVACWLELQNTAMACLESQRKVDWASYWLKRQEQADKLYRAAIKSLALIRELLPASAQPVAAIPKDSASVCAGNTASSRNVHAKRKSRAGFAEDLVAVNGCGVNRIAGLLQHGAGQEADHGSKGLACLNGHHNRLSGLLEACAAE
jgi:hypothetical protein